MPARFTVDEENLVIEMSWVGEIANIQRVVYDAANYLFEHGRGNHGTEDAPREFGDITDQERLDLVYNHFTEVAVNAADTWVATEAQRIARENAEKHEL